MGVACGRGLKGCGLGAGLRRGVAKGGGVACGVGEAKGGVAVGGA